MGLEKRKTFPAFAQEIQETLREEVQEYEFKSYEPNSWHVQGPK